MKRYILLLFCIVVVLSACTAKVQTETEVSTDSTDSSTQEQSERSSADVEASASVPLNNKLGNILQLGGKYRCTFTYSDGSEAIMYVERESYRMETTSQQVTTQIITKKEADGRLCTFIWSEASASSDEPQAVIKSCFTQQELESLGQTSASEGSTVQAPNNDIDVSCSVYTGTVNLNPPANLQVVDLTQLTGSVVGIVHVES